MTGRDDKCEMGYWLGKPFWWAGRHAGSYDRRYFRLRFQTGTSNEEDQGMVKELLNRLVTV